MTYPWTISLIVPALNEEAVIEEVVHQIRERVRARAANYEIILVDDGSQDSTGQIMERLAAEDPGIRVLHNTTNAGLGASFQRGLAEARLDYVMLLCGMAVCLRPACDDLRQDRRGGSRHPVHE
jgi:glycosyltransferase involved in cell wall biosynthesis